MKTLTKAEEQVMQVLWQLEKAFVKEIIAQLPEPKPAYNTVSTIVRILEKKGFVGHEPVGNSHAYFPTVPKTEYSNSAMQQMVTQYFGGSFQKMVSFFVKENDLSLEETDALLRELKDHKKDQSDA